MTDALNDDPVASAGEGGEASDAPAASASDVEVVVGEIPDAHDLSRMLWTARCTDEAHGLLGTVPTRDEAEALAASHLQGHPAVRA
jgi:hypothetical protein